MVGDRVGSMSRSGNRSGTYTYVVGNTQACRKGRKYHVLFVFEKHTLRVSSTEYRVIAAVAHHVWESTIAYVGPSCVGIPVERYGTVHGRCIMYSVSEGNT